MKSKKNGAIFMFILLFLFWAVLTTGLSTVEAVIGVIVSFIVLFYSYDLIFSKAEATRVTLKTAYAFTMLGFTLVKEIIIANVQLAVIVLSPKLKIDPGFQKIEQPVKKVVNQTFYGNAITLTPGTLTVDMDEEAILVHGLTKKHLEGLRTSAIRKAFVRFEEAEK